MRVFILMQEGPEWSNIIDVYRHEQKAEQDAAKLNAVPDSERKDVFERLSTYEVIPYKVKE